MVSQRLQWKERDELMSWSLFLLTEQGLFGCAPPIHSTPAVGLLQLWKLGTETRIHIIQGGALGNVEGKMAPSSPAAHLSGGLGHCGLEGASGLLKGTLFST